MEMGSKQPQDKVVSGQQHREVGDKGRHKKENKNKTKVISNPRCAQPCTRHRRCATTGDAQSHPIQDIQRLHLWRSSFENPPNSAHPSGSSQTRLHS